MIRCTRYFFTFALVFGFLNVALGQKQQHKASSARSHASAPVSNPSPSAPPTCKTPNIVPHIALVSPEFIVLPGGPKPSTITVLGTCLTNIYFVPAHSGSKITLSTKPDDTKTTDTYPFNLIPVTGSITFDKPDVYRVCTDDSCATDGPRILVTSDSDCGSDSSDPAFITQLSSEAPPTDTTPPAVATCTNPPTSGDTRIDVDASSGNSSLSSRTPLELDVNQTVQIVVEHKNPFRETYNLDSTNQPIQDDDIGSFLSLLVPSLGGGSTQQAGPSANTAAKSPSGDSVAALQASPPTSQAAGAADNVQSALGFDLKVQSNKLAFAQRKSIPINEQTKNHIDAAQQYLMKFDNLNAQLKADIADPKKVQTHKAALVETAQDAQTSLQKASQALANVVVPTPDKCARILQNRVDNLVLNYRFFAGTYNELRNQIVIRPMGDNRDCQDLLGGATALWTMANIENAKLLDDQIAFNLRDVVTSNSSSSGQGQADSDKNSTPGPSTTANTNILTASNCVLQALHTKVSPALSASMTSLESVLINPGSFISSVQIGPYADKTQVDWTLTKTILQNPSVSGLSLADLNAAIDQCVNPPAPKSNGNQGQSSLEEPGVSTKPVAKHQQPSHSLFQNASFRLMNPQPTAFAVPASEIASDSGPQQSHPAPASPAQTPSGSQQAPSDQNKITLQSRRINFGKERFIVSIGAVWAHLSQQSIGTGLGIPLFDASGNPLPGPTPSPAPSPSPTPPAITTIITQTDHSKFRISPMAFLNTRIFDWKKWNEPVYFTFGITAKSSDSGVKPEYLLGISQALYDRKLFITSGVYIGQQSYLAGNLKFNQQIPSGLTGSPTVNSVYGAGFTIGLSWRVPGLAK